MTDPRMYEPVFRGEAGDDIAEQGLIRLYSIRAKLMLEQYDTITQLLGTTTDWTPSGTHCEILLREFLRQVLPVRFRVDKGYFFGMRQDGESVVHCPEIDILIHEEKDYRPIFRLEDFVIVDTSAAWGAIQVKRCMDSAQLKAGLQNVMKAREHCNCLSRSYHTTNLGIFSAVLFFDEASPRKDCKPTETYRNCVREVFQDPKSWPLAPNLIGSLKTHIYHREQCKSLFK